MSLNPTIRDVFWEATRGTYGWFLALFAIGCVAIALGRAMDSTDMNDTYALALLLPLPFAAIMGTASIWSYRTRHHWPALSSAGRTMLIGAALWNWGFLFLASGAEQVLTSLGILDRPSRDIETAVIGPLVIGCAMAFFVTLPRK